LHGHGLKLQFMGEQIDVITQNLVQVLAILRKDTP
jgi:hypothetical protein